MKSLLCPTLICLFLVPFAAALAQEPARSPVPELPPEKNLEGPPLLTVDPAALLAAYPAIPPTWQLKRSDGRSDVSVQNLPTTTAIRSYRVPADKEVPEFTFTITVVDLGSQTSTLLEFRNQLSTAGQSPAGNTTPFSPPKGFSGLIKERGDNMWRFDAAGTRRFVLQIDAGPVTRAQFKELLGGMDLSRLLTLENAVNDVPTKGNRFAVRRVDEIHPANTRNSTVDLFTVEPNEPKRH